MTFSHAFSAYAANIGVLPDFGPTGLQTHKQLAQLGSDGTATAREMYPDIDEAALIRRIDIRVVPILSSLFLLSFLDGSNIANAAVYGMAEEIELVGNQFNAILIIL